VARHFGNFACHVEAIDVATPATFIRYTNNWMGCTQGWEWLPGLIPETFPKELPGLKHFFMVGQWVQPGGGVTSALGMGRDLVRIICQKEHLKFQVR
jgi:phytoene dehydrogenase-like protein